MGAAAIVSPGKGDLATFLDAQRKGEIGIGRHALCEVGAEHLLPVIRRNKALDDVARDDLAAVIAPIASLHGVFDQRLDLDHFAAFRGLGHDDAGGRHAHGSQPPSMHADNVTITCASADQKLPSCISATASTRCVSAMRMLVETLARPIRGLRLNFTTSATGFFSE